MQGIPYQEPKKNLFKVDSPKSQQNRQSPLLFLRQVKKAKLLRLYATLGYLFTSKSTQLSNCRIESPRYINQKYQLQPTLKGYHHDTKFAKIDHH